MCIGATTGCPEDDPEDDPEVILERSSGQFKVHFLKLKPPFMTCLVRVTEYICRWG